MKLNRTSAAVLLTLAALVGCGRPPGPIVAPVEGVITKQGQPLPGASVTFYPAGGRPSVGQSDREGRYSLRFTKDRNGAMVGDHQVTISYGGRPEPGAISETGEKGARGRRGVPTEVNWPESVRVEDTSNQIDFDLP